jgi:hypothetical protein
VSAVEEYKIRKSTVDDIAKLVRERGSVDLSDLSEYWNGKAGELFTVAQSEGRGLPRRSGSEPRIRESQE